VSDAIVPLVARAGFEWMATDEEILAKSVGVAFARGAGGEVAHPELLYAAHALTSAGAHVACAFRDRTLSDLIGFTYASWAAEAAADDFVARLAAAGRHGRDAGSGAGEPTIFVILDGENAWEHFEGGGRPFLRALYSRLARHDELRTVTMAEACRTPARQLTTIFPGSWIDANFYIWIGHADDQRAWSQLADAREELERADRDGGNTAAAREEILIAEGSDWFWWYGDDHSSAHDLEFDDLFRRHLRNAYRLLGRPVPDELFVSNISAAARPAADTEPSALLTPTIDGEVGSYFEWLYAGQVDVSDAAGAMHQGERHASVVRAVRYGCDLAALYVRVDAAQPMVDLLAAGYECSLKFLQPDGVRYSVKQDAGRLTGRYWDRRDGSWSPRHDQTAARAAAGAVLEVALPLADLGATAGTPLAFFVAIYDPESVERERHPAHRPISLTAPDPSVAARHWSA
jgi:alpha-amylase/alpha-mannosidase (GH57 family)